MDRSTSSSSLKGQYSVLATKSFLIKNASQLSTLPILSHSSSSGFVLYSGWMRKKSVSSEKWKNRFLELKRFCRLVSFEEIDGTMRFRGSIDLNGFSVEEQNDLQFAINTPKAEHPRYFFECPSLNEKKLWIQHIHSLESITITPALIHSGFLFRQKKLTKNWQRCFATVIPGEFDFFNKESDDKPSGSLSFSSYDRVLATTLAEVDHTFAFKLFSSSNRKLRTFFFACETEFSYTQWLSILKGLLEGGKLSIDIETSKNEPLQTAMCLYTPNTTVGELIASLPNVSQPSQYQLIHNDTFANCDFSAKIVSFWPLSFLCKKKKDRSADNIKSEKDLINENENEATSSKNDLLGS